MQLPYNFLNEIHHKCCLKSLILHEVLMIKHFVVSSKLPAASISSPKARIGPLVRFLSHMRHVESACH